MFEQKNGMAPTFAEAAAIIAAGGIDRFQIGQEVTCWHAEYGMLPWRIIGINCEKLNDQDNLPHITVMCKKVVTWRQFSLVSKAHRYGHNVWRDSDARAWLRAEFMGGLREADRQAVAEVLKMTHMANGAGDVNVENFFLLSQSELGFKSMRWAIIQDDGPVYPYFQNANPDPDDAEPPRQLKDLDDDDAYYWTRSPNPGNAYYVRFVYPSGELYDYSANLGYGLAPACAISISTNRAR